MLDKEQQEPEHLIEEWMLTAFQNGGIERFDDLHVDRIHESWHTHQLWAEGGLAALQIAVRLRDHRKLPVEVALGFSLQSDTKKIGVDFKTLDEFIKRLDWTPPSLYLFRAGIDHALRNEEAIKDGHVYADAVVTELDVLNIFSTRETGQRCFYTEFKRTGQTEYCRSVLLHGEGPSGAIKHNNAKI